MYSHSVGLFNSSQWDGPDGASRWYVVYRLAMSLLMGGGVMVQLLVETEKLGPKWFTYLSNQAILLLAVHYFIYALIVLHRRLSVSVRIDYFTGSRLYR